jgi:hypothetical protein
MIFGQGLDLKTGAWVAVGHEAYQACRSCRHAFVPTCVPAPMDIEAYWRQPR